MPFCGLSLRRILTSVLVLGSMVDLIAFCCNPERGSGLVWAFNQVQNISHRVADAICENPEDCRHVIDQFFACVSSIPQDVLAEIAECLRNATAQPTKDPQDGGASAIIDQFFACASSIPQYIWAKIAECLRNATAPPTKQTQDSGTVQQQQRNLIRLVVASNYSKEEAAPYGNATKAKDVIKSLRFSSYQENNLCDLKEGILPAIFNVTVDQIAALTNMPDKLKDVIKTALNFKSGNVLALDRLQFKSEDGNMVFGKIVVIRRDKVLDMAYSLHAVAYQLKAKQRQPENAEKLKRFTESLEGVEDDEDEASVEISIDLREAFLAYFHEQAIRVFNKHCDEQRKSRRSSSTHESY